MLARCSRIKTSVSLNPRAANAAQHDHFYLIIAQVGRLGRIAEYDREWNQYGMVAADHEKSIPFGTVLGQVEIMLPVEQSRVVQ